MFPLLATQPPTCPNKSGPTQSSEGLRLPVVITFPSVTKKGSVFIDLDMGLLPYSPFAVLSKHVALHTVGRPQTVPWGKFSWPRTKTGQPERELSPCLVQKLFYCLVTLAKAFQKGPVMHAANQSDSGGVRFSRNPN